jgi:peptide chain release factor 1
MRGRLEQLTRRLTEVDALLASPETASNMDGFRKLSRERSELEPVVLGFKSYMDTEADIETAIEMLGDPDMKDMAEDELKAGRTRLEQLAVDLQLLLLPKDPDDGRSLFIEIRAGTGGDEAALFAGDLLRMYTRYADLKGWKVEIVSESEGTAGGYKEVVAEIKGRSVFAR